MKKNIVMKVSILIVLALFVLPGSVAVGWAELPFSAIREAEGTDQFSATVDGTSINFDWSAMVAADSYTLAVALADAAGNVDTSTLHLFEMGRQRTFLTSGLQSGMIFYAVIMAHTDQGLVLSNTVKFMPFAGVTTYPESGDTLMQLIDAGGIGSMQIYGSRVGDDEVEFARITGDDGTGLFVLTIVGDEPISLAKGDLNIDFTGLTRTVATTSPESYPERTGSAEIDACQSRVNGEITDLGIEFHKKIDAIDSSITLLSSGLEVVLEDKFQLGGGFGISLLDAIASKLDKKISRLIEKKSALVEAYNKDKAELLQEYEDCSNDPDPGDTIIDLSCPVPAGAEYDEIHYSASTVTQYLLNGAIVGPWRWWTLDADSETYLQREACKNAAGELDGWAVEYFRNGNMKSATHYKDGVMDGHDYLFFCDGSIYRDNTYVNGVKTYSKTYNSSGELCSYWEGSGPGYIVCKDADYPPSECE